MLLGAIIEAVAGQDYFDYVREHIYVPTGMENTDAYEADTPTPNLAVGYTYMTTSGEPDLSIRRNNLNMRVMKGGRAGGGFSTVEDLLRFDRPLTSH